MNTKTKTTPFTEALRKVTTFNREPDKAAFEAFQRRVEDEVKVTLFKVSSPYRAMSQAVERVFCSSKTMML